MSRTGRMIGIAALALVALVAYAGARFVLTASDAGYGMYAGSGSLEEARAVGALLGTYTATGENAASCAGRAYAERVYQRRLGALFQQRVAFSEVVRVVVTEGAEPGDTLVFADGAGLRLDDQTGRGAPHPAVAPDRSACCLSYRGRVPERFWVERDGARVCRFDLEGGPDLGGEPVAGASDA